MTLNGLQDAKAEIEVRIQATEEAHQAKMVVAEATHAIRMLALRAKVKKYDRLIEEQDVTDGWGLENL
jgi:hypothetical protein